jgi:hypothetical protein
MTRGGGGGGGFVGVEVAVVRGEWEEGEGRSRVTGGEAEVSRERLA